jgi:hypothetical protein
LSSAFKYKIEELSTAALMNNNGKLSLIPLPTQIQYSSVHAIMAQDSKVWLGGNSYRVKPQFGKLDASEGWMMSMSNGSKNPTFKTVKSLGIEGEIREIRKLNKAIIFAANNGKIKAVAP